MLSTVSLLTAKPVIYAANLSEAISPAAPGA